VKSMADSEKITDKQALIARIRDHYAKLGIPLDALSDRDVELGVRQLAAATREAGTGSKEATEARRAAVAAAKQRD
jgi:hypothetical protein